MSKAKPQPTFTIVVRPLDDPTDPSGVQRLKAWLKHGLRSHRLKCTEAREVTKLDAAAGRRDHGSEQLPIGPAENPWDVPASPGEPSPSSQVAGEGEA